MPHGKPSLKQQWLKQQNLAMEDYCYPVNRFMKNVLLLVIKYEPSSPVSYSSLDQ